MSRENKWRGAVATVLAWLTGLTLFFPVAWMLITSLKSEREAIRPTAAFRPTLENYAHVLAQSDYGWFALNSLEISITATVLTLVLAIPAAYAMAIHPTRRTRGLLLWMLSTKMMPAVGVLMPIYLICRVTGLLDTQVALIVMDSLINLPIVVWMLFSFFKDVPREIFEAGRIDGAGVVEEIIHLLLPLALPGVASAALLCMILCWNEAFWSLNLTASDAAPLTAFIASFSSPEGLFFAKLSAASTLAVAPILVFGWIGQRQMVRGLTFGAVK